MAVIKKDYLTFDELRDRWGITDDEMHYMIISGSLIPCIPWGEHLTRIRFFTGTAMDGDLEPFNEHMKQEPDELRKLELLRAKRYLPASEQEIESDELVGGFLFLKLPEITIDGGYRFVYATRDIAADPDVAGSGPWFRLKKDLLGKKFDSLVYGREIPSRATFFNEAITLCEEKHPELRKLSQAEDQKQMAQNDQGLDKELSGKSVGTVAKIIGGLLMTGHCYDIHTDGRFSFIGEVLKDLESVGAAVNENTLRDWINRAKEVIEPPKKT